MSASLASQFLPEPFGAGPTSRVRAAYLIDGDLIVWEGRRWQVDYTPPVHDGVAYVPVAAGDDAECLEIPANAWVPLCDHL